MDKGLLFKIFLQIFVVKLDLKIVFAVEVLGKLIAKLSKQR